MSDRFPLIAFHRALIPGTRHHVVTELIDLEVGATVVVALERADGSIAGIGTSATVEGVAHRALGVVVDLIGDALVTVTQVPEGAEVTAVDRVVSPGEGLVGEAESALRSYMAARAEAGMRGDVHVTLDPDPVTASHQVASHLEISWPEVQDIFEAGNAGQRLEHEIKVLRRETLLLQAVLGRST